MAKFDQLGWIDTRTLTKEVEQAIHMQDLDMAYDIIDYYGKELPQWWWLTEYEQGLVRNQMDRIRKFAHWAQGRK